MLLKDKMREYKEDLTDFLRPLHPMLAVSLSAEHIESHFVNTMLFDGNGEPTMSQDTADIVDRVADLLTLLALSATATYTGGTWWYFGQNYWFWVFVICIGVCHHLFKLAKPKVNAWYNHRYYYYLNKNPSN